MASAKLSRGSSYRSTSLRRLRTALTPSSTTSAESPSPVASPTTTVLARSSSTPQTRSVSSHSAIHHHLNLAAPSYGLGLLGPSAVGETSGRVIRRKKSSMELELEEERRSCAGELVALIEPRPLTALSFGGIEEILHRCD